MKERKSSSDKMKNMNMSDQSNDIDFAIRLRQPMLRRTPPIKTTLCAIFLLIGGTIFLTVGLTILLSTIISDGKDRGISLIVLGGIMFIPGSYATCIIYGSWNGWTGYDYSQIPSYDD